MGQFGIWFANGFVPPFLLKILARSQPRVTNTRNNTHNNRNRHQLNYYAYNNTHTLTAPTQTQKANTQTIIIQRIAYIEIHHNSRITLNFRATNAPIESPESQLSFDILKFK